MIIARRLTVNEPGVATVIIVAPEATSDESVEYALIALTVEPIGAVYAPETPVPVPNVSGAARPLDAVNSRARPATNARHFITALLMAPPRSSSSSLARGCETRRGDSSRGLLRCRCRRAARTSRSPSRSAACDRFHFG